MNFDWNDYLTIAEDFNAKTLGQPSSNINEAMRRTALSRAYYSIYNLALEYAKDKLNYKPNSFGQNQFHSDIRSEYQKQLGSPDHQEVSKILMRMNNARKSSDYNAVGFGNSEKLLTSIILDAQRAKKILN